MGSMSWSDDIRCLYCDGRLPLYRKITHGQFCSSAHRKAYWQEQERLAVERLHQTHDSLVAHRGDLAPDTAAGLVPVDLCIPPRGPFQEPEDWRSPEFVQPGLAQPSLVQAKLVQPVTAAEVESAGEFVTDNQSSIEPPFAAFLPVTLAAAVQWAPGAEWNLEPIEMLSDSPLAPLVDFEPASVAGSQPAERLEGEPDAPFDAPFNDRMYPLTGPESSAAFSGLDVLSDGRRNGWGAQCVAVEFPPTAESPLKGSGPNWGWDTSLAASGAVPVELQAPRAQASPNGPVAQRLECLGVQIGLPAPPQLQDVFLARPAVRLAAPSEYTIRPGAARAVELRYTVMAQAIPPGDVAIPVAHLVARGASMPLVEALQPLPFQATQASQPPGFASPSRPGSVSALYLLPQPAQVPVILPHSGCEPLDAKPVADAFPAPPSEMGRPPMGAMGLGGAPGITPLVSAADPLRREATWKHVTGFWKHAPRDLRLLVIAIPALIALIFHPHSLPKVSVRAPQGNPIGGVLGSQFANVKQSLMDRAAVALDEDFRSGLDGWVSRGNATAAWSFDATGFVQPGPLALYQPSMGLSDYQMQFLGMIDQKALSWVVRANDFENYYVIKLVVLKPGPLPEIGLTRYAVIDGKAESRADTVVPISARPDMLYRVRMDLTGSDYLLEIQGQVIDTWSEPRLRRGGIGFFSARGEQSRVRWVQVTHQYDMLGRLCAYLAPYNIPTNGSW